jgi:hypothetical protein
MMVAVHWSIACQSAAVALHPSELDTGTGESSIFVPLAPPLPYDFIKFFNDFVGLPNLVPHEEKMLGFLVHVQSLHGPPGLPP